MMFPITAMLNNVTKEKLLILTMFVVSGVQKIQNPCRDARRMKNSVGVGSKEFMQLVGVFELGMALHALLVSPSTGSRVSLTSLALFTVAATLMFYTRPFKQNQFLSNMATLGGLMLLMK